MRPRRAPAPPPRARRLPRRSSGRRRWPRAGGRCPRTDRRRGRRRVSARAPARAASPATACARALATWPNASTTPDAGRAHRHPARAVGDRSPVPRVGRGGDDGQHDAVGPQPRGEGVRRTPPVLSARPCRARPGAGCRPRAAAARRPGPAPPPVCRSPRGVMPLSPVSTPGRTGLQRDDDGGRRRCRPPARCAWRAAPPSAKSTSPLNPGCRPGPPAADASTTSAIAVRSDSSGVVVIGCGCPSTVTAIGPVAASTTSRAAPVRRCPR